MTRASVFLVAFSPIETMGWTLGLAIGSSLHVAGGCLLAPTGDDARARDGPCSPTCLPWQWFNHFVLLNEMALHCNDLTCEVYMKLIHDILGPENMATLHVDMALPASSSLADFP